MKAWSLMGGLDWTAFELVSLMLGVDDPHTFAERLAMIRDHFRARAKEKD